jgi:N-acetyl-gamma-glutamyl-phosphate reductase
MKIKVGILGSSGYTAAELIKILLRHPQAEILAVTSRQESSVSVADLHPVLQGRLALQTEMLDADRLVARGITCVFGCLPHGASMSALPALLDRGLRVIDLSADYRLRDANSYAQWYGESHRDLAYLAQAVYGLPELYGEEVETAQLVANPGCYPQAAVLGLAPLVIGHHIDLRSIIIDSKSGVSGAGRTPQLSTHFPECNESVSAYNVGRHRHTPEIEQALGDIAEQAVNVIFTPHLVPMNRGIFTTIYATPRRSLAERELLDVYREFFARAPFVRVLSRLPATKDSAGTNFIDLTLRVVRERIVILVALDNLMRGASGVAVQNFNRMHGFEETAALMV